MKLFYKLFKKNKYNILSYSFQRRIYLLPSQNDIMIYEAYLSLKGINIFLFIIFYLFAM
jgi:hypothetical protein